MKNISGKEYKPSHGGYAECPFERRLLNGIPKIILKRIPKPISAKEFPEDESAEERGYTVSEGVVDPKSEVQLTEFLRGTARDRENSSSPCKEESSAFKSSKGNIHICPKCKIRGIPSFLPLCHHCESLSRNHAH